MRMAKNTKSIVLSGFFLGFNFLNAAVASTYSLKDSFSAALKRAESVAVQTELVEQAAERRSQSIGALLPNISGVASYTQLDQPPGTETAFTRPDRPEARITASQAVFRGFREFAALSERGLVEDAAKEAKASAVLELYREVASSFYAVLSNEQDLKNLLSQIALNQKRASELNERKRIGRSRTSEVLTVESNIASLQSQEAMLRGQLAQAREMFAFLTGLASASPLDDSEQPPNRVPELSTLIKRIEMRPDIRRLGKLHEASDESVAISRGGHFPSIDAFGNYYLKRVGALEKQKWDVQAVLTLPIYSGGVVQSQLREAVSRRTQAELELSQARRSAEQEIRTLYQTVLAERIQLTSLERAATLAERGYTEQSREYRLGLVTNLEVLQALNAFQDAKRALDRARFTAKLDYLRLETAAALRELGR